MTSTANTVTRDYTSEVRKVPRIKICKGDAVRSYDYIVDIYDNLCMVTGIIDRNHFESNYQTGFGVLVLEHEADVRIKDGDIYEPFAGCHIANFLEGLVQVRKTTKEQMNAVFNSAMFSVFENDTADDLYARWNENMQQIRAGLRESYKH